MKVKYTNRYNEVQTFEVNERGNIQWKADFEFNRVGFNDDPQDITMVDPSGGPYIMKGNNMGIYDKAFYGMIVKGFISNDDGYEIVINKEQTVNQRVIKELQEVEDIINSENSGLSAEQRLSEITLIIKELKQ